MRKIKFRLWDVEEKCFMNHSHVIESRVLALENNGEGRFIFQQWTGLLDRQGREIYEGDIVKNVGPYSPTVRKYGFGEFKYTNEKLVVCKELVGTTLRHIIDFKTQNELPNGLTGMSPNGWYGPKPPIDNEQFWNFQRSFEVIGNIYKNPELLLEEKTHD